MSDIAIINQDTKLGGARYPFIPPDKRWAIVAYDVELYGESITKYGELTPCLRWVNGNKVHDLYVEGINSTTELSKMNGLQYSLTKGGFDLSKRLSRVYRPYFISGYFDKDEITVRYLQQDEFEKKIWDGAGRISRKLLLRLIEQLPTNLSPSKRRELIHELEHAKRVEFTLLGKAEWSNTAQHGQDKGHAAVVEDLDVDIELPQDTKSTIKLENGKAFLGIYPVHAHRDHMRLDFQSLINLHPFINNDVLLHWLEEESRLFVQSIRNGDVTATMQRLNEYTTLDNLTSWHVREYLASGGHPMWFGNIVKSILNQHIKRLITRTDYHKKINLPMPGGRYYVMVDRIGYRNVPYGKIELDPDAATAWVNADQWYDELAEVWGGADQDDALWIFQFRDTSDNSKQKLLCWRSPNQLGEYVILEPTDSSYTLQWQTAHDPIIWTDADSTLLPIRIDKMNNTYLGLVDPSTINGLGKSETYSIHAMSATIKRVNENRGSLGMYCNLLMLWKALDDDLPHQLPDLLENVIDAAVKTGASLKRITRYCFKASEKILNNQRPIPRALAKRLSIDYNSDITPPKPVFTKSHWIDELMHMVEQHIKHMRTIREELQTHAMPPIELFQYIWESNNPQWFLEHGANFNKDYALSLGRTKENKLEAARSYCEDLLSEYANPKEVLLGALANYYLNPNTKGTDDSCWQLGEKLSTDQRHPGIAQMTLNALRDANIIKGIAGRPKGGIYTYPVATAKELPQKPIKMNGVWFNWLCGVYAQENKDIPSTMSDVDTTTREWAKQQVKEMIQTEYFRNLTFCVTQTDDRHIVYVKDILFGFIDKTHQNRLPAGTTFKIEYATVQDGNITALPIVQSDFAFA